MYDCRVDLRIKLGIKLKNSANSGRTSRRRQQGRLMVAGIVADGTSTRAPISFTQVFSSGLVA